MIVPRFAVKDFLWEKKNLWIHERINNSIAGGENLNVVCSRVIQPACLWLWVIRCCEELAASLLMTVLHVPLQLPDIGMETFNDPVTRQHVTAGTCSASRLSCLPWLLSVSLIGLIRLSLYESSIRSSVPTSYGSLVLYLSHSTKEKLCVKSLVLFTPYPRVFIMPMSLEGAGGWLVVCSRTAVEYAVFFGGLVSECVSEGERSRLQHCLLYLLSHGQIAEQKGRLADGHTLPSSGLHCRWYVENAVLLGCREVEHYLVVKTRTGSYSM